MQESDGQEHHIRDSQYWWPRASGVRKSHGDPPESRAALSYDLVAGASKIRHKSSQLLYARIGAQHPASRICENVN